MSANFDIFFSISDNSIFPRVMQMFILTYVLVKNLRQSSDVSRSECYLNRLASE